MTMCTYHCYFPRKYFKLLVSCNFYRNYRNNVCCKKGELEISVASRSIGLASFANPKSEAMLSHSSGTLLKPSQLPWGPKDFPACCCLGFRG